MVFKRYTAETKAIHPRSLSDESWRARAGARVDGRARGRARAGVRAPLRRDARSSLAGTRAGRADSRARRSRARSGSTRRRGPRSSSRTCSGTRTCSTAATSSPTRRSGSSRRCGAACANDRVNWVVKLHPANVWKRRRDRVSGELDELVAIRERVGELPPHVRLLEPDTDISTWSLFDVTDFGVTIRGSVGFELPCFGVPVLTAGTGFYSGRGFTVDSETARRVPRAARARSTSSTRRAPRASSSRSSTRTRSSGCARRASRASARVYKPVERDRRSVRGDDRG